MASISPAAPARASTRAPARPQNRRKRARPPQPQMPRDFFDATGQEMLTKLLMDRAESWQNDWLRPLYFYGRNSEPHWDAAAQQRISGTTLRIVGRRVLIDCLSMDLERALRLLILPWHEETRTIDGHDPEDWRGGLAGALWRIGQLYRECARRWSAERAQTLLAQIIDSLWK